MEGLVVHKIYIHLPNHYFPAYLSYNIYQPCIFCTNVTMDNFRNVIYQVKGRYLVTSSRNELDFRRFKVWLAGQKIVLLSTLG